MHTGTPSSTGTPVLPFETQRVCGSKTENTFSSCGREVCIILREAVCDSGSGLRDLAEFTRECFAPFGGVELDLPPRGLMREPPSRPN